MLNRASGPEPVHEAIDLAFRRWFPAGSISARASFVSLGGDSLNYAYLSMDIERLLGYLPEQWENLTLGELQNLVSATAERRSWWSPHTLESETVMRALAIVAVVIQHTNAKLVVGGGSEVLLILAGYNLARYQQQRLFDANGWIVLRSFFRRIILPYYLILVLYLIYRRQFDIPSLFLVSNFFGRFHSLIEPYWFLETLLQCIFLMVTLFAVPPVRAAAKRDPWRFGLALLGFSVAVKVAVFLAFHHQALQNRTPDAVFYLFALGWCVLHANTTARRGVITAIILLVAMLDLSGANNAWFVYDFPSNISFAIWLLVAILPMLWVPHLSLPGLIHKGVTILAAASFYIYLMHGVPIYLLTRVLGMPGLALNLAASLAIGIATWILARRGAKVGWFERVEE
jgi:peptidoglycan/LPS O-acetylase OafA/YrhL